MPFPVSPTDRQRLIGTMTHDHKRNGTPTLFAALNVLDGTVIDLQATINRYLAEHNQQPKPFVWIADLPLEELWQ